MIYRELNATFGALNEKTLKLKEGLNIVYGPNESGKSTWGAFLRAMLYGISTREQSKIGFLADKEKYKPWSGAPMYGRLRMTLDGRPLCIERTAGRTGVLQKAEVTYEDTGLTAEIPEPIGETLLGVKREVFDRSAFTAQGGLVVNGDKEGELARRITSLVQTGDEEATFSTTKARLEKWRRARKYNRSGIIPAAEEQLLQDTRILEQLREEAAILNEQLAKKQEYQEEATRLEELRDALETRRAARQLEEIRAAEHALEQANARVKPLPNEEKLHHLLQLEQTFRDALRKQNEPMAPIDVSHETLLAVLLGGLLGIGAGVAVGIALKGFLFQTIAVVLGCLAGLVGFCVGFIIGMIRKNKKLRDFARADATKKEAESARARAEVEAALADFDTEASVFQVSEVAQRVRKQAEEIRRAQADAAVASERLNLLLRGIDRVELEQKAFAAKTIPPELDLEHAMSRYAFLEREIRALELDCAARLARIEAKGSLAELEERSEQAREHIAVAEAEYAALTLALDTLSEVNGELERRFAPVLEKKAAELLSEVTDGHFRAVDLRGSELELAVRETEAAQARSTLSLSGGTLDELYLCLRLAICDTIFEKPIPIILDDVFVNYDDVRLERMLRHLKKIAASRQIILFTCHQREPLMLQGDSEVNCVSLA